MLLFLSCMRRFRSSGMLLWSLCGASSFSPTLRFQPRALTAKSSAIMSANDATCSFQANSVDRQLMTEPRGAGIPTPYYSRPADPSFVHPPSEFPALSLFERKMVHPALVIPARETSHLRKRLSHIIMHRPKIKSVYAVEDDSSLRKLVLKESDTVFDDPELQLVLSENDACYKSSHSIHVTYEDWSADEVLRQLLPVSEIPSAFETIGPIAHVNLRPEVLPFKHVVGRVILDKNGPRIRTVVNKLGTIETEFRTFGMEVIAGEKEKGWNIVRLKEDGCQFELDFQNVYWNTRLGGEHNRLVALIRRDASDRDEDGPLVVADLMAGVGPFAVPLTAAEGSTDQIIVHANDLNPASFKYLRINAGLNKCRHLHTYCMDGRALVHTLTDRGIDFHHALMNLPASAPECLDAFRGFTGKTLPRLHVHCFGAKTGAQAEQEAMERCSRALGCPLDRVAHRVSVRIVRDVAPNKNMLCVTFSLPGDVRSVARISIPERSSTGNDEPDAKRPKQK